MDHSKEKVKYAIIITMTRPFELLLRKKALYYSKDA